MKQNRAGGFAFELDHWAQMRRWLVLGSEGGTYYASQRKMTKENVGSLRKCVKEDGIRVVEMIVDMSTNTRIPKQDTALFALAIAGAHGDPETKAAAAKALPRVARTATHLFMFVAFIRTMRGWGRWLRRAVCLLYTSPSPRDS